VLIIIIIIIITHIFAKHEKTGNWLVL